MKATVLSWPALLKLQTVCGLMLWKVSRKRTALTRLLILILTCHPPITSHDAGYINKDLETIVGLQTEKPLKRAIIANGGIRMVETSCEVYGRKLDDTVNKIFTDYRKTHNAGVFDVYTADIRNCRKSGVITGLPDAYGRGRIIGDYRRIALYGIDRLVVDKKAQHKSLDAVLESGENLDRTIQLREEIMEQIKALMQIKEMAAKIRLRCQWSCYLRP